MNKFNLAYTIAVDFDGTLCENKYPDIGEPIYKVINYIKQKQSEGCKIILNTCRSGDLLNNAIQWCKEYDLSFDAVNENLQERIECFGGDTRKISADLYIDDKAINMDYFNE